MPFNWDAGTTSKFNWDDGTPVVAPLPVLPRPAVSVEPQGSWLVRGAGKVASATSDGGTGSHPLSPAGFARSAMTAIPQTITEATGRKYTSLPERVDAGFNAPGGLRDTAQSAIDAVGGRGTTESIKQNFPIIPAAVDVAEEGLKFVGGLGEFSTSPTGVALPYLGKTTAAMREAARVAQAGTPEAAAAALRAKVAEQATVGAGAAFGADMTQVAVPAVQTAVKDPTVKNVAAAGFAVAGAGLPLLHSASEMARAGKQKVANENAQMEREFGQDHALRAEFERKEAERPAREQAEAERSRIIAIEKAQAELAQRQTREAEARAVAERLPGGVPSRVYNRGEVDVAGVPVTPTGLTAEMRQRGQIGQSAASVPPRVMGQTPYQQHLNATLGDVYSGILPSRITEAQTVPGKVRPVTQPRRAGRPPIQPLPVVVQSTTSANPSMGVPAASPLLTTDIAAVTAKRRINKGLDPLPPQVRASRRKSQTGALNVPNPFAETEVLTPEQQWAADYAAQNVAKRKAFRGGLAKSGLERVVSSIAKAKSEGVDSLSPILDTAADAQRRNRYELMPESRFEKVADAALSYKTIAGKFLDDHKVAEIAFAPDSGKYDSFSQFMIAKEAVREGVTQQRETGRNMADDIRMVDALSESVVDSRTGMTYGQLADKVYEYGNGALLNYAVEHGIISKSMAEQWRKDYSGQHIPLARTFSAIEEMAGPSSLSKGRKVADLVKQTVFQKRKGSLRPIEDPIAELLDRTYSAVKQATQNEAAKVLASYADLPGFEGMIREATGEKKAPKHSISYLDNGERRVFETTREWEAAAKSLDVQSLGVLGQIVSAPVRLTKTFTTGVNLPFALANLAVDAQTTGLVSKNPAQTILNPKIFVQALKEAALGGKNRDALERAGGGFTSFNQFRNPKEVSVDYIRRNRSVSERGRYIKSHPISALAGDPMRAIEDAVGIGERAGRIRIYMGTKKAELAKGHSAKDAESLAVTASNNELPNYLRAGNITRVLNSAFMYLNAGVQGSRNFVRAVKDRPAQTAVRVAVGVYFPTAVATLWNLADPERKKIYDDIRQYEKDNNLVIVLPWAKLDKATNKYEGVLKLKMDPGAGKAMAYPVRKYIEALHGEDPATFGDLAEKLVGAFSPVEPTKNSILSTTIPQILKPSAQAAANYDYFRGGPKLPRRLQSLPPQQQVMPNTSGTIRRIAGLRGVSPVLAEEFVKDTIGGAAPQLIHLADSAAAKLGLIPQDEIGGQSTLDAIGGRFTEARAGESDQKIYDALDKIKDKAMNRGVEILRADPRYQAIQDKEQRLALERKAASSVAAKVSSMSTSHKEWDTATYEQKMSQLRYIDAQVGGKPALRPLTPPTR